MLISRSSMRHEGPGTSVWERRRLSLRDLECRQGGRRRGICCANVNGRALPPLHRIASQPCLNGVNEEKKTKLGREQQDTPGLYIVCNIVHASPAYRKCGFPAGEVWLHPRRTRYDLLAVPSSCAWSWKFPSEVAHACWVPKPSLSNWCPR